MCEDSYQETVDRSLMLLFYCGLFKSRMDSLHQEDERVGDCKMKSQQELFGMLPGA